jgi:tRNA(Ile)-lysidine synthase TilS/MesJ
MIEHKFKTNIRMKLNIKKDRVLLCLSGGPNSTSMVLMAANALI